MPIISTYQNAHILVCFSSEVGCLIVMEGETRRERGSGGERLIDR